MRWYSVALLGVIMFGFFTAQAGTAKLQSVNSVDLKRYTGVWYEIAKYPNRFQRDCDQDTTATYSLMENGKIKVLNVCFTKEGKEKRAEGSAKVADEVTHSKLKVTFFWPFYCDYWIIDLDKEYQYAVVGEPSRNYLWILSRTPQMDDMQYQSVLKNISNAGYDTSKLVMTKQTKK
jgi:apolipoprotein D and lipocalin family protein